MLKIFLFLQIAYFSFQVDAQQQCRCSQIDSCVKDFESQREQQMVSCRNSCKSSLVTSPDAAECYAMRDNQANIQKQELKSCMQKSGIQPGNGIDWDSMVGGGGMWGGGLGGATGGGSSPFSIGGGVPGLGGNFPFSFGGGDTSSIGSQILGGTGGTASGGGGTDQWSQGGGDNGGQGGGPPNGGGKPDGNVWTNGAGTSGGSNGGQRGGSGGGRGGSSGRSGINLSGNAATEINSYEQCVRNCAAGRNSQSDSGRGGHRRPRQQGGGQRGGGGVYAQCASKANCQLSSLGMDKNKKVDCFNQSGYKTVVQTFCSCLQSAYGASSVNCDSAGQSNSGGGRGGGFNRGGNNGGQGGQGNNNGGWQGNNNNGQGNTGGWSNNPSQSSNSFLQQWSRRNGR